jgi:hypothetical protein
MHNRLLQFFLSQQTFHMYCLFSLQHVSAAYAGHHQVEVIQDHKMKIYDEMEASSLQLKYIKSYNYILFPIRININYIHFSSKNYLSIIVKTLGWKRSLFQ